MNVKSKALRILGIVGGVFFSILLVAALLMSLVFATFASLTKPESIVSIVKEMDFAEQLMDNDTVNSILKAEKIDTAVLDDLADSRFFEEVIETYTDELIDSIRGDEDDFDFTSVTIQKYADRHMDDLILLVRQYMPANRKATDAQIQNAINDVIDEYGVAIVDALPGGKEVSEMIGGSGAVLPLSLIVSSAVPIVLYSFAAVLAVLVFICLLHKFRGLLCLGIDALSAAVITLIPYLMLAENGLIPSLLDNTDVEDMLDPIFTLLADKMLIHIVILAVLGVLFIAGYIVYIVLTNKATASPTAPAATANGVAPPRVPQPVNTAATNVDTSLSQASRSVESVPTDKG